MSWKFNNFPLKEIDPRELTALMLSDREDIKFWSKEALKELYHSTVKTVVELCVEEKKQQGVTKKLKSELTRYINTVKRANKVIKLPTDREKLLEFIYKEVLRYEGMGLLPGFKFGRVIDGFGVPEGDPERESIVHHVISNRKSALIKQNLSEEERNLIKMASKRDAYAKVFEELKVVLGLEPDEGEDPAIYNDPLSVTVGVLTTAITEAAGEIRATDSLTAESIKIIEAITGTVPICKTAEAEVEDAPAEAPEKEEAPAKTEKAEAPAEEAKDVPLADKVWKTKKLGELKDLVTDNPELAKLKKKIDSYTGLQGTKDLKKAILKELGLTEKPKATPKPKGDTTNKWGHRKNSFSGKIDQCLMDATEPLSFEEIAKATGSNTGKVKVHIRHLKVAKDVKFEEKDGKVKVTE